jgi:hypothetical protein
MVDQEERKREERKDKKPSIEDENYQKLNCKVEALEPGTPDY